MPRSFYSKCSSNPPADGKLPMPGVRRIQALRCQLSTADSSGTRAVSPSAASSITSSRSPRHDDKKIARSESGASRGAAEGSFQNNRPACRRSAQGSTRCRCSDGFACIGADELPADGRIVVSPWGRIEGDVVGANTYTKVYISPWKLPNEYTELGLNLLKPVQLSPTGHFSVARVAPGKQAIGKYLYLLFLIFATEPNDRWCQTFWSEIDAVERK